MSKKKQNKPSDGLVYIKDVKEIKTVSEKEIEELFYIFFIEAKFGDICTH